MNKVIIVAVLALILSTSTASALDQLINVNSQDKASVTYPNVDDSSYTFSLKNPPFNLTYNGANNYTNESLFTADSTVTIHNRAPITTTQVESIKFIFNTSHYLQITATYEKHHELFIFDYFNVYYSAVQDGVEICNNQIHHYLSSQIVPELTASFAFNQRGSYNSVSFSPIGNSNGALLGSANVSGEVLYNPPSLDFAFTDNVARDGTFISDTLDTFTTNPCAVRGFIEPDGDNAYAGFLVVDLTTGLGVGEMQTAPVVYVSSPGPVDHKILYQFQNQTVTVSQTASAINAINNGINSCIGPSLLGLCIYSFIGDIFSLLIKIAVTPISTVLNYLPGGGVIKNAVGAAWDGVTEVITLGISFLLMGGPNWFPGGILWALLVWMVSLGFLMWGFTGRAEIIFLIPWYFLKYYGLTIFFLTVGLFVLLPLKIIEILAEAIP